MKKQLFLILSFFCFLTATAQQFNNEWIDYSKTYYKFKVGATGLYRIPQNVLSAANLGGVDVTHFQLWHNGQEVPIYTSNQTGALPAAGFIEFWGEANDGKPDQVLYRNTNDQINTSKSLFTDTAAYFLTVNPAGNNKRLVPASNSIPVGVGPEPYFMHTSGIYPNESIHLGPYVGAVSEAAISASYEMGEGWTSNEITENKTRIFPLSGLFPFTGAGAPAMQIKMNVVGNSPNSRTVRTRLNNTDIFNTALGGFAYAKWSVNQPVSILTGATENIAVSNVTSLPNNRIKMGLFEITYPRAFNFGGASNFRFSLPAAPTGKYLEITGFNYTGTPVLYDLSDGRRYEANVSNPSLVKVYVQPAATSHDLVLVNTAAANIKTVNSLEIRNFIDYSLASNQGNYLMITHDAILNGSNGSQPIEEYRAYRSTAAGGGYNAKVYLIDQLIDQFALGIKQNPLAVRNFLRFARNRFSTSLRNVFIVGHGLKYTSARTSESSPATARLNLIPTFGSPASDVLLAAEGSSSVPLTPIGRVSVISGDELSLYLEKVKQYEQHFTSAEGVDASIWKKNVMHIVGANDQALIDQLYSYLNAHKVLIKDTFYGAHVTDFVKSSLPGSQQSIEERLRSLINGGANLLTYFGHSGATTLAFKLEDPANYSNYGKYPVFHMMGCNVGDIFILNENRLSSYSTISERYLFAKERGSIGMMAGTSFGYVYPLQQYNRALYKLLSNEGYRLTLGELMQKTAISSYALSGGENDLFVRAQNEEFTLNGDPAIRLYQFDKPDYAIEDQMVTVSPDIITIAETHFTLKAKIANLGKALNNKLIVELKRTFPDLSSKVVRRDTIEGVRYLDSISYRVDIDPSIDKGANKFTITIDPENTINELFETNNSITKEVFIFEDDIKPVFPYNYSIVNKQDIVFAASTGNPLAASRNYIMELDTTKLFNSSLKKYQTKISSGGVVEFAPNLTFKDSTVYYWRVGTVPTNASEQTVWSSASFVYLPGTENGYNQSHYYQLNNELHENISIDDRRSFYYDSLISTIRITNTFYTYENRSVTNYAIFIDEVPKQGGFLKTSEANSLRFYLVDNKALNVIKNVDLGTSGRYGSFRPIPYDGNSVAGFFQFDISTPAARKTVMNFLDSIPTGYYVGLTSAQREPTILPSIWQSDTSVFGANNSLYHKLKSIGLSDIDQIHSSVPYVFIYQKGNPVPLVQSVADTITKLNVSATVPISGTTGTIKSPVFARSTSWNKLVWDGYSLENPSTDKISLSILGVDRNGIETPLIENIPATQKAVDLSSINTATYPGLRIAMRTTDTENRSTYQLKYWSVYGTPVPEGAVAPNLYYNKIDSIDVGEPFNLGVAFKNISNKAFDSINVKLIIRNKNNIESIIPVPKLKALFPGDTVKLNIPVNTQAFAGTNLAYVEFNPEGSQYQPEQHQYNNFIFQNFHVRGDTISPQLDVTYDGTHILNRDIISSKPNILMKLTDNARYLLLNNTDLVKVQLRHPDGTLKTYQFDSDTLSFTPPSQDQDDNTAVINFKPHLLQDGEYELLVSARDESGNNSGNIDYRMAFQVINKPMISNLLNYPNPFTTSTAFVFTLTGSDIPQNIRIQILTITGKIVREITKAELGPLRIGRNITEFKWDGTDQYGQKLANGVYLYRVLTNLNGKSLDKYKAADDNTDRYFNKGYGKMVLIR